MLTLEQPVTTTNSRTLYRDDTLSKQFYSLPATLSLVKTEDGEAQFTMLFYQADAPERGARLVAGFTPVFPEIDLATVSATVGPQCQVTPVTFTGGDIRFVCSGLESEPFIVSDASRGCFWTDLSLSQDQARFIRQTLKLGSETIVVRARLCYHVAVAPQPLRAWIRVRQAAQAVRNDLGGDEFIGETLSQLLPRFPTDVLTVQPVNAGTAGPELAIDSAQVIARLLVAQIADPEQPALLFNLQRFKLRLPEQIAAAELMVDLRRPRARPCLWEGEWSMSAFHAQATQQGTLARYFPELLSLPPVGMVDVLVENLLPVDGTCIDQASVKLRYRRLNSMEESVFGATFGPYSPPVVRCSIPHVALTDFFYWFQAQVRLTQEDSLRPGVRLFPEQIEWVIGKEPFVRIDGRLLPFALAHVAARPEVFLQVGRVDVEFAPAGEGDPETFRTVTLVASTPQQWITLDPARFGNGTMRWRPVLHSDISGNGRIVVGAWQSEGSLSAVVTAAHVYLRDPIRVQAKALFRSVLEVQAVSCEIALGSVARDAPAAVADLRHTFVTEEEHVFVLWPQSIFDNGFSYRYGIQVGSGGPVWTVWRQETGPSIVMNAVDEFYTTRMIRMRLLAPWSALAGPDASRVAGEVIFAEVNLRRIGGGEPESASHTFDKTNVGTEVSWKIRVRKGQNRIAYDLSVLTVDGRLLSFGPYETDQDRLSLEIYAGQVSDAAPAEFGFRSNG